MKRLCYVVCAAALLFGCGQGGESEQVRSASSAEILSVPLRIVIAGDALAPDLLDSVQKLTASRFAELGVRIETAEIIQDAPEPDSLLTIRSFWDKEDFDYWKARWASDQRAPFLTVVYTRPLIENGQTYFGGWSSGVCRLDGGFAVIHTKPEHLLKNALVDTHEKAHLLGAPHDESLPPTIMHPDAGALLGEDPAAALSAESQAAIRRCVGYYGKRLDAAAGPGTAALDAGEPDLW